MGEQDNVMILEKGVEVEPTESKVKQTTPYMTRYERARILGTRALQIRYKIIYDLYCKIMKTYALN
jgi:hypothetical protein